MKTSELQLGDMVSCLGDPVIVVSLSFNGDEPIGIILPLNKISKKSPRSLASVDELPLNFFRIFC